MLQPLRVHPYGRRAVSRVSRRSLRARGRWPAALCVLEDFPDSEFLVRIFRWFWWFLRVFRWMLLIFPEFPLRIYNFRRRPWVCSKVPANFSVDADDSCGFFGCHWRLLRIFRWMLLILAEFSRRLIIFVDFSVYADDFSGCFGEFWWSSRSFWWLIVIIVDFSVDNIDTCGVFPEAENFYGLSSICWRLSRMFRGILIILADFSMVFRDSLRFFGGCWTSSGFFGECFRSCMNVRRTIFRMYH